MTPLAPELAAAADRAVAAARERFGARRAALFWPDAGGDALVCLASAAARGPEGWVGQRLAAGVGMAGRAVAEGRPVWTPDLLADPKVPVAAWLRERMEAEGLRSVAAAPLRVAGVARGALGLLDAAGRRYDDEALRRFGAFADDTARDLERAVTPR
jgi:GAF domain-containing protein